MKNNTITVKNNYSIFTLNDNLSTNDELKNCSEINLDLLKENLINNLHILELMNTKFKNMILFQLIFCYELFLKYELAKINLYIFKTIKKIWS